MAHALLPHLLRKPQSTASQALDWAHEIARAPGAQSALRYRLCEHFLWRGEPDRIASLLDEETDGQGVALRAAGYARAASELDTGLAIIQGRPWQPTQPPALAALFAHEAPWQRMIAALESLAFLRLPVRRGVG